MVDAPMTLQEMLEIVSPPEFVAQTAELQHGPTAAAWGRECQAEADADGLTSHRMCWTDGPDGPIFLFEAWREKPAKLPEPFFFLTAH
jgi:hypothetical protein